MELLPRLLFEVGDDIMKKTKEALMKSARADGERFAAQPQTIYSEFP